MRIFCDTASLNEIEEWDSHPWVSGFTTNPTLMRNGWIRNANSLPLVEGDSDGMTWAREVVRLTDKPISIDGPPELWELGPNVWRKTVNYQEDGPQLNYTAVCSMKQVPRGLHGPLHIISVFAGRIMDTGRDPQPVIDAAKDTGAQVLWASVREPYNIVQAEQAGCDIVTVPPAILRKYLDWHGKPLDRVGEETIAQFERDSAGLW